MFFESAPRYAEIKKYYNEEILQRKNPPSLDEQRADYFCDIASLPRIFYPLIAPAVNPLIMFFCRNIYTIKTGTTIITTAAAM